MSKIKRFNEFLEESIGYSDNSPQAGQLQKALTSLGIFIGNFGANSDGVDNIAGKFTFTGVKILLDLLKDKELQEKLELDIDPSVLEFSSDEISDEQEELIISLANNNILKSEIRNNKKEIEEQYKQVIKIGKPKRNVQKYIEEYGLQAVEASKRTLQETGKLLYPSVMLAQSALESGWGKSGLTRRANNFFGIKVDGNPPWNGEHVNMRTREVFNGKTVYMKEPFRKYDTAEDSFYDRNNFLLQNKRYGLAGVFDAQTPVEQIQALKKAGYATAPEYVQAITNILYSYGMEKFDDMVVKPKNNIV